MTTQPAKWPPRVTLTNHGKDEGMYFVDSYSEPQWEYLPRVEHEALIAEARAECWRDAAIEAEELAGQMVNDTDKELVLEQKGYFECVAAQYSEARPQPSEPERKA
jgi:hypothetical protein